MAADKKEKEYVCGYKKYCLHHGEKVKASEVVVIGQFRYHWDCAAIKQEIAECVSEYMSCVEDKTVQPIAYRAIQTMVFKNNVPADYILDHIKHSKGYYSTRPVQALYGIRKAFWEKTMK